MELIDVLNHALKGGQFEYKSFHYKEARQEFLSTEAGDCFTNPSHWLFIESPYISKHDMSKEIIEKHSYWRLGKIRSVNFNPNGSILRIYIGAKWARPFYYNNLDDLRLITTESLQNIS